MLTVEPHGRNKNLADALKRIGLAEKTGRGIDRIFEGSILFGRPWPDYSESTKTMVKLFIQRAKPDFHFMKMLNEEQERNQRALSINSLLILSCLKYERRVNLKRIMEITHISESKAIATIGKLVESGLIEATGKGKNRTYILSAKVYNAGDNMIGYIRQTDIDELRYEELVLKFAKKSNDGIKRREVSELLKISKDQSYRLLKKLVKENKLTLIGKGNQTRYKIK